MLVGATVFKGLILILNTLGYLDGLVFVHLETYRIHCDCVIWLVLYLFVWKHIGYNVLFGRFCTCSLGKSSTDSQIKAVIYMSSLDSGAF